MDRRAAAGVVSGFFRGVIVRAARSMTCGPKLNTAASEPPAERRLVAQAGLAGARSGIRALS